MLLQEAPMREQTSFLPWSTFPSQHPSWRIFLCLTALLPAWACVDLEVTNINEPDSERALADLGDPVGFGWMASDVNPSEG